MAEKLSWRRAPEIAAMAGPMMVREFPHLVENQVRVEFLLRNKQQSLRGSACLATCGVVKGLNAFLRWLDTPIPPEEQAEGFPNVRRARPEGDDFFVIQIHEESWVDLCDENRKALLHHEMAHCGAVQDEDTGELKLFTIPHDIEAFKSEAKIYGTWRTPIADFAKVLLPHIRAIEELEEANFREQGRRQ